MFVAVCVLSLAELSRGCSRIAVLRLLIVVASLVAKRGLSGAPRHVGSSWSRDRTCVSCIGRQILNHWTTGEG